MAIAKHNPNTIRLSGDAGFDDGSLINDIPAGVATIRPGMLIEMYSKSGVNAFRPNSSATNMPALLVALEQVEFNLGVDALYNTNDLVQAWNMESGNTFWGLIPSGQNIATADYLQSNGDGTLKAATAATAAANVARFQALESSGGAVTVLTRLRVQVI